MDPRTKRLQKEIADCGEAIDLTQGTSRQAIDAHRLISCSPSAARDKASGVDITIVDGSNLSHLGERLS